MHQGTLLSMVSAGSSSLGTAVQCLPSRPGLGAVMRRTSPPVLDRACKLYSCHIIPEPWLTNDILLSEYDFYTFNTISGGGNVTVTTYVAPTLNGLGPDQRLKIAVQVDSLDPVTTQFIPAETPGNVPPGWDGLDGFVVRTLGENDDDFSGPDDTALG